jgi:hypothetical protein
MDDDAGPRRAFISTYEKLGYIEDGNLVVLSPKKEIGYYRFQEKSDNLTKIPRQDKLLQDALGFYQGTNYLYKNKLTCFPPDSNHSSLLASPDHGLKEKS